MWKRIFPEHYQDKYQHPCGMSGGGGNYPFYDIHLASGIELKSHEFGLGHSIESFRVPHDYYLKTGNKSTLARCGIDASFNTYIDNGFEGYLTIEIVNHSETSIILDAGTPILKVELIPCLFNAEPYKGKYQNQPARPVKAL